MFVDKIPGPDEEGFVRSVGWHSGGSAPNTMVGLSRLGVRTGCIGRVGPDAEGSAMVKELEDEGVETERVRVVEGRSGTALVLVDKDGLRAIVLDPGVNDGIPPEDLDPAYLKTFDLIHMTSFVCRTSELSFRTQLGIADAINVPLSLDPGQLYAERGLEELKPIIRNCRIVMPNEKELRLMTGLGPKEGARLLLKAGAEVVAVKMGMGGSYVTNGRLEGHVSAYRGKGVDTTGAGDAYNAGFIFGLLNGMDPLQSGELGARVAWLSVQKTGARDGLPSRAELSALEGR